MLPTGRRSATHRLPGSQQQIGILQPGLDAAELAAGQQRAGKPDNQCGPDPDHLVRQLIGPIPNHRLAPGSPQFRQGQLDKVGGTPKSLLANACRIASG